MAGCSVPGWGEPVGGWTGRFPTWHLYHIPPAVPPRAFQELDLSLGRPGRGTSSSGSWRAPDLPPRPGTLSSADPCGAGRAPPGSRAAARIQGGGQAGLARGSLWASFLPLSSDLFFTFHNHPLRLGLKPQGGGLVEGTSLSTLGNGGNQEGSLEELASACRCFLILLSEGR